MTTQRSTFFRFALIALSGVLFTATVASATLWVRVSDENLVRQTIERGGLVVEVEAANRSPGDVGTMPSTQQRMLVRRMIHGDLAGADELTVRWRGGETADGVFLKIHGVEPLTPGATALLFLKPGAGDTWDALHLFQGVFETVRHEGRDYAFRSLGGIEVGLDGKVLTPAGDKTTAEAERSRDLEAFVSWVRGIAQGEAPAADYWREVPVDTLRTAASDRVGDKFTLFDNPFRWQAFDVNATVSFRAHQDGQDGLSGGGFGEFQNAINAWNNDPGSDVMYRYAGMTGANSGFNGQDFVNTIIFNNVNNAGDFDEPFSCGGGGVIAVGGGFAIPNGHIFRGQSFGTMVEADIVTNENTGCILRNSATAREVFAHELGHTLGLGHSCSGAGCAGQPLLADALMRSTVHADGRGARLNADDRAGINFLYPSEAQVPPTAPTGLSASNGGLGIVNLAWSDNSGNENGFFIERRLGNNGTFFQIGSTSSNARNFQDSSAPTGSVVGYRVRAFNGAGNSSYTNVASVTTSGPTPPSDLLVTPLSAHALQLDWTDNTADETGFEIQIRREPAQQFVFATLATTDAGATQQVFDELFSGSSFQFRVRALTETGNSSWSQPATAATLDYPVGEPCQDGFSTLCLNGNRFQNRILWREFAGLAGLGNRIAADLSTDSGLFWFFGANNWELLVKNLNGCGVNQAFWVFSAATTNVEYTLQVVDTWTGEAVTYFNPLGDAAPAVTDIGAFPDACSVMAPVAAPSSQQATAPLASPAAFDVGDKNHGCTTVTTGTNTTLFLDDGRFEVEVDWRDFEDNDGPGRVVQFCSDDSGLFWFFGINNWELLVKVLNACGLNDHYWVFSAATTNVEYTLKVTDTETDLSKSYFNPLGQASEAVTDTLAFATCP